MPKKQVSKKKGIAKRKTTAVADIQKQLGQEAVGIQDQIGKPATNAIKTRDKQFTLPDGQIMGDTIEVVIVDFVSRNNLYEGKWDPNNPTPPSCFAINKVVSAMAPSDNSPDKQAKDCAECPMNQFGSDGDGKACKNTRLLAVVIPGREDDGLMTLSVPPTAIKGFDGYVGSVAKLYQTPPIGVVTKVSFHPEKSYTLPIFGDPEPNENLQEHFALREDALEILMTEPDVSALAPKKKTAKRR